MEEMKQLSSTFQSISKSIQEEFRTHYLGEIISFFPDYSLKGLQCRFCVRDKMCWRGQTQGYTCGLYFILKYPDLGHRSRILFLAEMCKDKQTLLDFIAEAAFLDLLILCILNNANVRILSRITSYGLRYILFHILSENNPSHLLTTKNFDSILSPYFVQQGETGNAEVNAITNS